MPLPHSSERTGGNPRTYPGSSVGVVAFLLGGAAWYAAIQSDRLVVGLCRRGRSVVFSFFLSFLLGLIVLFAPAVVSSLYRVVAILI